MMKILITILKLLGALLFGGAIGLVISVTGIILFTDISLSDFLNKLNSSSLEEGIIAGLVGFLSFIVSGMVLIVVHEAGHLICGLISGYKFVSFRIGNLTLIRQDGRLRIKKYSMAGTGGQCLLSPPEGDFDTIPTSLYNAGGVLANIICLIAALPLLFLNLSPFLKEALIIFIFTDLFLIAINGIPMKINGVSNDGKNILLLRKNSKAKHGLVTQLRLNAMIQSGTRPKDIPEEMFYLPDDIDYTNALEVSLPVMYASWLTDRQEYAGALEIFESLYAHKDEIIRLYVKEIACEMVFLYLVTRQTERACELLDKNLKEYISAYRKVMSSKERILCAIALFIDNDRASATEIYEKLRGRRAEYLLKGEINSDLALMEDMLATSTDWPLFPSPYNAFLAKPK